MARIILLLFIVSISSMAFGQQQLQTIYLDNGDIFIGEIVEITKEGNYVIKTLSGEELVFLKWQIKSIAKGREIDGQLEMYGGNKAAGLSVFGNGFIGGSYHFGIGKNFYVDGGVQFSMFPVQIDLFGDGIVTKTGLSTFAGFSYYLGSRYGSKRDKVKNFGVFLQTSHTFSNYCSTKGVIGIRVNTFKLGNIDHATVVEVGYAMKVRHWIDSPFPSQYAKDKEAVIPLLHIGFHLDIYHGREK